MQRVRGRAEVSLAPRAGATRLVRLAQAGSAKAFLPRVHGTEPEVVFLNTAGGLTGGDRLRYALELAAGGRATATTQTAERGYRASGGMAEMEVALDVRAGAELHWLPQETILFEGAALARGTRAELAADARLLFCETIVLGRAAMGETVARVLLEDRREVRRDGRPVLVEPLRLCEAVLAGRDRPGRGAAGPGAARALATVALVAPGAEDALGPVRAALAEAPGGLRAAASAWDGRLVVRALAGDGHPLRRLVARVLTVLRGRALPRVWQV